MRLAVAAALGSLALAAPGDRATAAFQARTLSLTLHYLMTCGQPGPGPLAIALPAGFRAVTLRAQVAGKPAPVSQAGRTVDVTLANPPHVTCMSIGEGTLRVSLRTVYAARGSYVVKARVRRHTFAATVHVS